MLINVEKRIILHIRQILTGFLVIVSVLRIWLLMREDWQILPGTGYDDYLQLRESVSILSGDWMGAAYDKFVMAKNPGYPLFLALCNVLRIPYPVGYGLLMILSAGLFCAAIRPIMRRIDAHGILTVLLYTAIIYSPIPLSAMHRIYRNAISPWSALWVIAAAVGIYLYRENPAIRYVWALIGAAGIAFFWILREDGIWIIPALLFIALLTIVKEIAGRRSWKSLLHAILPVVILFSGIPVVTHVVSSINESYYGLYEMNDRTEGSITDAMEYLYKIDDGDEARNPDAWISRKAVRLALQESKTLEDLDFEAYYSAWAGDEESDLKGDTTEWALRDAAEGAGYYKDSAKTAQLYEKIADELGSAFEDGRLKKRKGLALSNQTGVFSGEDFAESMGIALRSLWGFSHYDACENVYTTVNIPVTSWQDIELWENALGIEVPRSDQQMQEMAAGVELNANNRQLRKSIQRTAHIEAIVYRIYRMVSYPLFIIACVFFGVMTAGAVYTVVCSRRGSKRKRSSGKRAVREGAGAADHIMEADPGEDKSGFEKEDPGIRQKDCPNIWVVMMTFVLAGTVNLCAVVLFSRFLARDPVSYPIQFYASAVYMCLTVFMYLSLAILTGWLWRWIKTKRTIKKNLD